MNNVDFPTEIRKLPRELIRQMMKAMSEGVKSLRGLMGLELLVWKWWR
jgi:hypothetical protein